MHRKSIYVKEIEKDTRKIFLEYIENIDDDHGGIQRENFMEIHDKKNI